MSLQRYNVKADYGTNITGFVYIQMESLGP